MGFGLVARLCTFIVGEAALLFWKGGGAVLIDVCILICEHLSAQFEVVSAIKKSAFPRLDLSGGRIRTLAHDLI